MSKRRTIFIASILLIVIFFEVLFIKLQRFEAISIIPANGMSYLFKSGTSVNQLVADLKVKSNLKNGFYFKLLLYSKGVAMHLQAGEYFFPAGSTPKVIIEKLSMGNVVQHSFTIVNGWNIYQILNALAADPYVQHTLTDQSLQTIATDIGCAYVSPEGVLFPDTYFFPLNTPDIDILWRAYVRMQLYMDNVWPKRAQSLPYKTPYQALVVASMIEKEAGLPSEMPIIAGIILKRLALWMPLQIDSTVIYGLQPNFSGNLTVNDLKKKTPYNTYTHYGLPPTPIAMPGSKAILAALHPEATDYLYFVATGKGGHEFSKTLSEQDVAVKKYQLKQVPSKMNSVQKTSIVKTKSQIKH